MLVCQLVGNIVQVIDIRIAGIKAIYDLKGQTEMNKRVIVIMGMILMSNAAHARIFRFGVEKKFDTPVTYDLKQKISSCKSQVERLENERARINDEIDRTLERKHVIQDRLSNEYRDIAAEQDRLAAMYRRSEHQVPNLYLSDAIDGNTRVRVK